MKKLIIFSLSICFLLFLACEKDSSSPQQNDDPEIIIDDNDTIDLQKSLKKVIASDNDFGIDLFKQCNDAQEESENIFLSPVSVALALGMTFNGAENETEKQMKETLRLENLSSTELNNVYKTLINQLSTSDEEVNLNIANSIWYRQDFSVEKEFIDLNTLYYDARVEGLDFALSDAKDIINGWVEDKTNGKIKELISVIKPNHVMFLINAIYFKGTWTWQFDKEKTFSDKFYLRNGNTVDCDMMHMEDSIEYLSTDDFSAISLPYGSGKFAMQFYLPKEGKTTQDIIDNLSPETWNNWLSSFAKTPDVKIYIPKFKFKWEMKLNDILIAMGMPDAFGPEADFTGINKNGGLYIDYVKHKSFIEVNEEGAEAAAATVVAILERAIIGTQFYANKPFLFTIVDNEINAIVFIGKVEEPVWEE